MRQIMITGRLGADAEVNHTQQGTSYFSCRLANTEYGDKEGVTHWYRVTSYNPMHIKNVGTFKKGSAVIVIGRYDDHTYLTKAGTTEISRDIIANSIEYNNTGRNPDDNQQTQYNNHQNTTQQTTSSTQKSAETHVMPKMEPFKPVTEKAPTAPIPQTTVQDDPDDDLPF